MNTESESLEKQECVSQKRDKKERDGEKLQQNSRAEHEWSAGVLDSEAD